VVTGTRQSYGGWIGGDILVMPRVAGPWPTDFYGAGTTTRSSLTTVDLADPADPQVLNRDVIEGQIAAAREHDGTIRVVATTTPVPELDFVTPYGKLSKAEALQRNRELVEESTAAAWLPRRWFDHRGNGGEPLVDCTDVTHPSAGSGLGTISVITLDPDDPAGFDTTAISADGSRVYASEDRLYVSTIENGWDWDGRGADDSGRATDIHAFSTEGESTAYVASGKVEGTVSSQWSFSEYDGDLRVASSLGGFWDPTETIVTVLEEDGDSLVPVGRVGGMGIDEEVKSVRWFGDYAVVVTFRQIDPLYLLDLSDPTHPEVADELKVRGFSQYLHPIGDGILLGVGQVAARDNKGMQVSTFDLSDLRRLDQEGFEDASFTAVATDARAFTYLPDQHLALFPTDGWRRGQHAQLEVVAVGTDGNLTTVDEIPIGNSYSVRTLPLDGDRVALVRGGSVLQVFEAVTPIR
jgi:hypothetical protein